MLQSPQDWAVIVLVVLLLFGAKRLPEIGRSIGQGMREFKHGIAGLAEDPPKATEEEPQKGSEAR